MANSNMSSSVDTANVEDNWVKDLEDTLLIDENICVRELADICRGRPIPGSNPELRSSLWGKCLGVDCDKHIAFNEFYDLPEQGLIRSDCQTLVGKLGNDEEDKVCIVSDLERILTHYSKTINQNYEKGNGWTELLEPLVALRLTPSAIYQYFSVIVNKYVPNNRQKGAYHCMRLLLLYHDPELCSFLDTNKISPDQFASKWFMSLFSSSCNLSVTHAIWDIYFQIEDKFFIFFMSLVILVNSREQIMAGANEDRPAFLAMMQGLPCDLEEEDVEDFCSLASYYSKKTPVSFRKLFKSEVFDRECSTSEANGCVKCQISQALCLPITTEELTENIKQYVRPDTVRFFVVDCRPVEQYNSGHLPTAFHLDANLMLQQPGSFEKAVQALLASQLQATAASSVASGEHLTFVGSGREQEDQYVHMVVARFLQKKKQYVNLLHGGYSALHELFRDSLSSNLTEHDSKSCIVCAGYDTSSQASDNADSSDDFHLKIKSRLLEKVSTSMNEVKSKIAEYINNPNSTMVERHVSCKDKMSKPYRNIASVFSIDDDQDTGLSQSGGSSDEAGERPRKHVETVCVDTWLKKPEVLQYYECYQVKENGYMFPSHLLVTSAHLYILRHTPEKKGFANIINRRQLQMIMKITSKKKHPELITFKYGSVDPDTETEVEMDRFLIAGKAGDAIKFIKQQIMKCLES